MEFSCYRKYKAELSCYIIHTEFAWLLDDVNKNLRKLNAFLITTESTVSLVEPDVYDFNIINTSF